MLLQQASQLLKTQKFAHELDHLVDMSEVKMYMMKPWIAKRVTEVLGFEDVVLINFIYGRLEEKKHAEDRGIMKEVSKTHKAMSYLKKSIDILQMELAATQFWMVENSFVFLYALFGIEYVEHNSTYFGFFI